MRLGLGFLFFVSTCVPAMDPEEIWRDLGKLRGLKGQSLSQRTILNKLLAVFIEGR
jgi:hypothetical protein